MFQSVNYIWNRPAVSRPAEVSILPTGEFVTPQDGDLNLYGQASRIFGQLGAENVFTAPNNTFQDIYVRACM